MMTTALPDQTGSITVSVVSHGHGAMVSKLLRQLLGFSEIGRIILTLNVAEDGDLPDDARLLVVRNKISKGFGANHNRAFALCQTSYFCVLNPDIDFQFNIFPDLLQSHAHSSVGVIAPAVYSSTGTLEDSIRRFPTIISMAGRALGRRHRDYKNMRSLQIFNPDWVAGMFMLFPRESFARVGGFDERYFLYCEDVDICARLWRKQLSVQACPAVGVIHDVRRASRSDLRHFYWHLTSLTRYFLRYAFRPERTP